MPRNDEFIARPYPDRLNTEELAATRALVSRDGKSAMLRGAGQGTRHSFMPSALCTLSSATTVTRHMAWRHPALFYAWRVRLLNAHTAAMPMQFGLTTQSAVGDQLYNSATWQLATFNGVSTSQNVPAGSGTVPSQRFGYLDSDIMLHESASYSGGGTIVACRALATAANNSRMEFGTWPTTDISTYDAVVPGYYLGDGLNTPASYVHTSHPTLPPAQLTFYSRGNIRRVAVFTASTGMGYGDTTSLGWQWRAMRASGVGTAPALIFTNFGHAGSPTNDSYGRAMAMLSGMDADYAMLNIFSANDSDSATAAGVARMKGQMMAFCDLAIKLGITPVLQTWQHPTGESGSTYTNSLAINAFARALADAGMCLLFDVAALFSDETAATGTWSNASMTSDGTHPNAAGQVVMADAARALFV